MKAVILAAGYGRRIQEFTQGKPKCFLEVNGQRLIDYQVQTFKNAGITDVTVVVGYKRELFNYLKSEAHLVYNPFYARTNNFASFWFAKEQLTEPFVWVNGDTFFEPAILKRLLSEDGNVLAVQLKQCSPEDMKVKVKDCQITAISKELIESDGEFIGLAKFQDYADAKSTLDRFIEAYQSSFFECLIMEMIRKGSKFRLLCTNDLVWEEIDFKEDYFNLLEKLEDKKCIK
jgi:choline kinase